MSETTLKLPFKRFVAQVSTGAPRSKSTYLSLMAENLEALKACPWREAADVPVALADHDFTRSSHFTDACDAFKMTGAWNASAQTETAFAGMAAYRFAIPASAASVAISSVSLPVSRDRFLKGGVHVAVVRSAAATPTADWATVRGAGASAYLANDAANLVASRPADGALTVDAPAGTGGYLWVYLTLEDYTDRWDMYSDTEARQYAIEGSAMLVGGSAVATFASAVEPDAATGFPIAAGGVYPPFAAADRVVLSASSLAGGGDLPEPTLAVRQVSATTSALYYGDIKLKDIEGDARGIRIFASNVAFTDTYQRYCVFRNGSSFAQQASVRNVQFFAVLGVDGKTASDGVSYINSIGPGISFFVRYDASWTNSSSSGSASRICEVGDVHNYLDNISTTDELGQSRTISQEEYDLVAQTYSGYLTANAAHRMLAEHTAESITLVVGPAMATALNTAIFNWSDDLVNCTWIADCTVNCGVACAVYVSGAAGTALLGKFYSGAIFPAYNTGIVSANHFRNVTKFYPEGGDGQVSDGATMYALFTRESFSFKKFFWWVRKRIVDRSRDAETGQLLETREYTFGGSYGEVNESTETLITFSADNEAGLLRVGSVGTVPYKGKIHGVVRYNKAPTSSALVYGELEAADGRACSMFFAVTVRSNSLYVWIPPFERLGRPDSFEQLTVTSAREAPDWVMMSGSFSSIGGRTVFPGTSPTVPVNGLCLFSLATGEISQMTGNHPSADVVASAADNILNDLATTPQLAVGDTTYTLAQSGTRVAFYVTGDHTESRTVRLADGIPSAPEDEEQATVGLRCAYAKVATGGWERVTCNTMAQPGAAFSVRMDDVSVPVSTDSSVSDTQDVPMWRIAATVALVPFSSPLSSSPSMVHLVWDDSNGEGMLYTAGANLNVWLRRGAHLHSVPAGLLNRPEIFTASVTDVDGWELVGTIPASASGNVTLPLPSPMKDPVGTFLLTAYMPQDGLTAADFTPAEGEDPIAMGVGTINADPVNGTVSGYTTGWKPDITLI